MIEESYVYINGECVKGEKASISVWDHGLLYGDGVFEGIRSYDAKIFKLDEHITRCYQSAKALGIDIQNKLVEIKKAVIQVMRENNLRDAHIRIVITRGIGKPGLDPKTCVKPTIIVMAYHYKPPLGDNPVRLISSSVKRIPPDSLDAKIKSLNYLTSILAFMQATNAGCDDALLYDYHGNVAESTRQNIFIVKNNKLFTPWPKSCLDGITKNTVMDISASMKLVCEHKDITIQELYSADECFLTGTASEVVPVGEIDGRVINDGKTGRITSNIMSAYQDMVRNHFITDVY